MKNNNVLTNSDHGLMLINRLDTYVGLSISLNGNWELNYIELIKQIISKFYAANSDIEIVDAGSNIGVYSLSLSKIQGLNVKIIAIEAQRLIYQMLNANLALNSIENAWTYHRIISNENGKLQSICAPDLNKLGNFGAYEINEAKNSENVIHAYMHEEQVMTMTIDSLELNNCAFLKLDIEGMEDVAMAGAIKTIETQRPIIFFESHKTDFEECKQILKEYEYALWKLPAHNILAVRKEWDFNLSNASRIEL